MGEWVTYIVFLLVLSGGTIVPCITTSYLLCWNICFGFCCRDVSLMARRETTSFGNITQTMSLPLNFQPYWYLLDT